MCWVLQWLVMQPISHNPKQLLGSIRESLSMGTQAVMAMIAVMS